MIRFTVVPACAYDSVVVHFMLTAMSDIAFSLLFLLTIRSDSYDLVVAYARFTVRYLYTTDRVLYILRALIHSHSARYFGG